MNKWRDSCVRTQEVVKGKIEKLDKESHQIRSKITEKKATYETGLSSIDDNKNKDMFSRIESNVTEKEPLIISLISTAYDDLKLIHKHLNAFCAQDP